MKNILIQNKQIGLDSKPFIIAEMSGNHGGSLEGALKIVAAAAQANVDAIKLQTYTADTMTLNLCKGDFFISDKGSPWHGYSLYNLYQKAYTPWEWHEPIIRRCKELGLICFSTPFDETAVDFLEDLKVPCYKIASFENLHLPLIKKAAATGKPLIISTGMASLAEIEDAVNAARTAGCKSLILMKCNSGYPASIVDTNLNTIPHMRDAFNCHVGLSDHSLGIGASVASIAFGAVLIEKHFVISRDIKTVDSDFSMNIADMKSLVQETANAKKALGKVFYGVTEKEITSKIFRRSLYIANDISAGEVITEKNVRIVRPGKGLSPKYLPTILGKRLSKDVIKGTAVTWSLFD